MAAKREGLALPVVYNTSGYERPEVLRMLEGLIDVWLPDFKYMSETLAQDLLLRPGYRETALAAIEEMSGRRGNRSSTKTG